MLQEVYQTMFTMLLSIRFFFCDWKSPHILISKKGEFYGKFEFPWKYYQKAHVCELNLCCENHEISLLQ